MVKSWKIYVTHSGRTKRWRLGTNMTLFLTFMCFCERKSKVHYLSSLDHVPKKFHHRNVQQLTKKAVLHFNNGPLAWILDVFFCVQLSHDMGDLYDFFAEILWRKLIRNRQDLNRSNLLILRSFGWDLFLGGGWGEYKPVVFRDGIRVDFDDLAKEYSWSSTDDSTDRLGQSLAVEIFHLPDGAVSAERRIR